MRILWISFLCSWTIPLLKCISKGNNILVLIPDYNNTKLPNIDIPGVTFKKLQIREKDTKENMSLSLFKLYYKDIISGFNPDIIHVHGTEKNLAQVYKFIPDIPVVVSIQGLLSGCLRFNSAFLTQKDVKSYTSVKNILGIGGLYESERRCESGYKNYEKDILVNCHYFFGRTLWDKAHIQFHNPSAHYFIGEELLRDDFYESVSKWKVENIKSHNIFTTTGSNPLKGLHFALKAVKFLKEEYPDVKLLVPGMPLARYRWSTFERRIHGEEYLYFIEGLIEEYGIKSNIEFLPKLDSNEMVSNMLKSSLFLSTSTIDNSPNSIGEASMLGLPIVTTPVGGITSFMQDNYNCLYAPSGDSYMMAYQIRRVFEDTELANKLSKNSMLLAENRHNRDSISDQYLDAYNKIIELHKQII